jgi:hypothetical protein
MVEAKKKDPDLEQNKQEEPMSMLAKVIVIGLCGGIFWSLLGYLLYIFKFTKISPNLVLQPWAIGDWKNGLYGQFMGIFVIGLLSVGVALLYYATLRRFEKIWVSMIFGLALWGFVFFILNPIFPDLKSVWELGRNTNITTVCLYLLYGVFIGYSISFEVNDIQKEGHAVTSNS